MDTKTQKALQDTKDGDHQSLVDILCQIGRSQDETFIQQFLEDVREAVGLSCDKTQACSAALRDVEPITRRVQVVQGTCPSIRGRAGRTRDRIQHADARFYQEASGLDPEGAEYDD